MSETTTIKPKVRLKGPSPGRRPGQTAEFMNQVDKSITEFEMDEDYRQRLEAQRQAEREERWQKANIAPEIGQ